MRLLRMLGEWFGAIESELDEFFITFTAILVILSAIIFLIAFMVFR